VPVALLLLLAGCATGPAEGGPINTGESENEVCSPTGNETEFLLALPISLDPSTQVEFSTVALVDATNVELVESRFAPVDLDHQYIIERYPLRDEVDRAWGDGERVDGFRMQAGDGFELILKVKTTDAGQSGSVGALQVDYTADGTAYRYTSQVAYELASGECD